MAAEIIGTITCPHCGNPDATVHRQAKGKRSLYYRCYASPGSVEMRCGTVQIHGPKGQEFITANMKGHQPEAANDAKASDTPPAEAPAPKVPHDTPKRRSVMQRFVHQLSKEEE